MIKMCFLNKSLKNTLPLKNPINYYYMLSMRCRSVWSLMLFAGSWWRGSLYEEKYLLRNLFFVLSWKSAIPMWKVMLCLLGGRQNAVPQIALWSWVWTWTVKLYLFAGDYYCYKISQNTDFFGFSFLCKLVHTLIYTHTYKYKKTFLRIQSIYLIL